jgi:hypothetical protein
MPGRFREPEQPDLSTERLNPDSYWRLLMSKPTPTPTSSIQTINVKVTLDTVTLQFLMQLMGNVQSSLDNLIAQGVKIMGQLEDLNAAIQAEDVDIQQLGPIATKIDADIVALKAAVAAGATPADLTTQITAIQAHTAALATGLGQLGDSDTKANA